MTSCSIIGFRRYWPVGLILLVGLAGSTVLGWRLHRQAVALDRLRLERIGKNVLDGMNSRLRNTDLILRHGEDFFSSQENITEVMFREWCMKYGWSTIAPWIHGVAFYTNVNTDAWRSGLPPDTAVWTERHLQKFTELALSNRIDLKLAFPYCSDLSKRWPSNYEGQLEFRWGDPSPNALEGVFQTAILGNTPATSSRYPVIELADGRPAYGATLAVPIYAVDRDALCEVVSPDRKKVATRKTYYLNWNLCRGLLLAPIDYAKLESLLWSDGPGEVGVEIFASETPRADQCLNSSNGPPRALDPRFKPYLAITNRWDFVAGRRWSLFIYSLQTFEDGSPRYMAYVTFGAGAGLTLLAAGLVGVSLRARNRQERMTAEVTEARDALAAAEKEREKLGHDLHDGAIQSLYAIQLGLSRTAESVASTLPIASQVLSDTRHRLDDVIAELRRFILARREPKEGQEHVGLDSVLAAMVQRLQPTTHTQLSFEAEAGIANKLSTIQVVQLTQLARTALANCLRHANAQQVKISLRNGGDCVRLQIVDDGKGFDLKSLVSGGLGLRTMRTRAAEAGGDVVVESRPGEGTRVVVSVPIGEARMTNDE